MMFMIVSLLSLFLIEQVVANELLPIVQFFDQQDQLIIENGYVRLIFDKNDVSISELSSDFSGSSDFKTNVLARPFSLSTVFTNASRTATCALKGRKLDNSVQYSIKTQSEELIELSIEGIKDCRDVPIAEENWHISLHRFERFVQMRINGGTTDLATDNAGVVSIGHSVYTQASSLYGFFDRGVAQMMNNPGKCMGSNQTIDRLYALGNDQAVDVLFRPYPAAAAASSPTSKPDKRSTSNHLTRPVEMVFHSQYDGATNDVDTFYGSRFQDVLVGSYPHKSLGELVTDYIRKID